MSALAEPEEAESTRGAGPVDTDDPAAVCARLAEIEDELAVLQPKLSRAAHWVKRYKSHLERVVGSIRPSGANAEERKFNMAQHLEKTYGPILDAQARAEAELSQHSKAFDVLDSGRSILQSCLKRLLRDQEPQHGSGSRPD